MVAKARIPKSKKLAREFMRACNRLIDASEVVKRARDALRKQLESEER